MWYPVIDSFCTTNITLESNPCLSDSRGSIVLEIQWEHPFRPWFHHNSQILLIETDRNGRSTDGRTDGRTADRGGGGGGGGGEGRADDQTAAPWKRERRPIIWSSDHHHIHISRIKTSHDYGATLTPARTVPPSHPTASKLPKNWVHGSSPLPHTGHSLVQVTGNRKLLLYGFSMDSQALWWLMLCVLLNNGFGMVCSLGVSFILDVYYKRRKLDFVFKRIKRVFTNSLQFSIFLFNCLNICYPIH